MKIHANETETVLEALKDYQNNIDRAVSTVNHSTETWNTDGLIKRLEVKRETLSRVIARIEEL